MNNNLLFFLVFSLSAFISWLMTIFIIRIAKHFDIMDRPGKDIKIHYQPTALLGGLAIYLTFILSIFFFWKFNLLTDNRISTLSIIYFILAGLILMINGFLDDKYTLPAKRTIWGPILASVVVIYGGLGISHITSWNGGVLYLNDVLGYDFLPILITFLWLMGITYTTKLLDGIDGLVGSIGLVASIVIFVVSLSWDVDGSATSLMSLALAGALLGFLFLNWHPAKIFLGEAGSTFVGFSLGVLAIISGSKIATALLVMGLPVLDILWVIARRIKNKQAIWQGDKEHLHFKLLAAGLSQRKIVFIMSSISIVFGIISIVFTTKAKIGALFVLLLLMTALSSWLNYKLRQKHEEI